MTNFGQDMPLERPDADERAAVFVPSGRAKPDMLATLRKGAAIVGYGNHDGSVTVYFESNRFDDAALAKWEHKARKAYDRLIDNAPTVSKMVADPDDFEQIGYITGKSIHLTRMASLQRWLSDSDAMASCPTAELIPRSVVPMVKPDVTKA